MWATYLGLASRCPGLLASLWTVLVGTGPVPPAAPAAHRTVRGGRPPASSKPRMLIAAPNSSVTTKRLSVSKSGARQWGFKMRKAKSAPARSSSQQGGGSHTWERIQTRAGTARTLKQNVVCPLQILLLILPRLPSPVSYLLSGHLTIISL